MKISRSYSDDSTPNISASSMQSIEEYQKKRIETNIKLHKFFLVITIIINISLFLFLRFYKRKLSEIKNLSDQYSSKINSDDDSLSNRRSSIDHKIVNIGARSFRGGFLFSYILKNEKEINKVKNTIRNFYEEKNKKVELNDHFPGLLYQSYNHGTEYKNLMEEIVYQNNLVIFVEIEDNKRFGVFIGDYISDNDDNEEKKGGSTDIDEDDYGKDEAENKIKNVFLFAINEKEDSKEGIPEGSYTICNYIGKSDFAVKFGKKKLINVGEEDIVINNDYYTNGGKINFPFKNFDCSTNDNNFFSEHNGNLDVRIIEVLKLFD